MLFFSEKATKKRKTVTITNKAADGSDVSMEAERNSKHMKYVQTLKRWFGTVFPPVVVMLAHFTYDMLLYIY